MKPKEDGRAMRIKLLLFFAGLSILFGGCEENLVSTGSVADVVSDAYYREGISPVTVNASCETRTVLSSENTILWDQGDEIALIKDGVAGNLQLLDAATIQKMATGEKKSIILVNPANDGCFLGFNGSERVRNTDGLKELYNTSMTPEVAESNLKAISELAEKLTNNQDYIFTLEKVDEGWLLYHKASGIGLSSNVGSYSGRYYECLLQNTLGIVDIQDGSETGGYNNVVLGRPEQIRVVKKTGDCANYLLWSGGTSKVLAWNSSPTAWTSWLFFELPEIESRYLFKADESGASSTFTNNTGFTAGEDQWFAVYPYVSSPSCTNGVLSLTLPEVQYYQAGSFGIDSNVSVGVLQDDRIFFRNVCGVLKLSIQGTQRVKSIKVQDKKGVSLWGTASLNASSVESGDCSATVSGGSDRITLISNSGVKLQKDVATDFYLVVPVGAFSEGFDVEIVTTTGTFTRSTSKDNTIKRSDIKKMPVFTLEEPGTEIPTVNVENKVVQAYMAYGPYDSFGSGSSFLDQPEIKSLKSSLGTNSDKPAGYTVQWDSSVSATITVADGGNTWYTEDNITGGVYTITNLTPGHTYTYQVEEDGSVVAEGEFQATGQVRMVSITDAWNCRDMGGWTGLNGKTIKYGKLYRTASLNGEFIGKEGKGYPDYANPDYANPDMYVFHAQSDIDRLGIKAELDLRGDPDVPGAWGNEGTYHSASLGATKLRDADFMQIMTDWGLQYPTKRSSLVQDVAWIIQELKLGKPVAFHCRVGADRTGGVSYLVEGLLGVKEGDVARDYELTSFSSIPNSTFRYANHPNQSIFTSGMRYGQPGETFQERCYGYLNQYFDDVHINADDLDWFICEMLGLDSYERPEWAINYKDNGLDKVCSIRTGSGSTNWP